MNSKATKAALVTSLTSLVLCFTMLMGTTLAWFVDRVESTNNRIEAGNLEVDLVMLKNGEYVSIADGSGDLFAEAEAAANNVPWQPNMTKTIYLGIQNKGTLGVFYEATIKVDEGELLGVLDYRITDLGTTAPSLSKNVETDSSRSGTIKSTAQTLLLGKGELKKITEDPEKDEYQNETHYYAFTIQMKSNASASYQGKKIVLDIHVVAKQLSESDIIVDNNPAAMALEEAELPETLSTTSWKLEAEVADYSFLEKTEDEGESEEIIFPEETAISDGDITYPLSELRVIPLEGAKLLTAVPAVNEENKTAEAGAEAETEAKVPTEKVFVYYQKAVETTETDETVKDISGWYLISYEAFQTLISEETTNISELFASENKITKAEKLPVITFPDAEDDVLKNTDIINWLYNSAELLPAAEDNN